MDFSPASGLMNPRPSSNGRGGEDFLGEIFEPRHSSNTVLSKSTGMAGTVKIEVIGLNTSECSPFPCDENRTCGLEGCYHSGKLVDAFNELKKVLHETYGNRVELSLTLIDDGAPAHIKAIIERDYPPIPMVLVNGRVTKIGRITLDRIKAEIEKDL
jgi:hypothetical protein